MDGKVPRVLLAHENALFRMGVTDALVSRGYAVVAETRQAVDIVALARRHDVAVAVVGTHVHGHETIPEIRELSRAGDVRIIAVGGPPPAAVDQVRFLDAGAAVVAMAAVEPEELATAVRRVLAGDHSFFLSAPPVHTPEELRGLTPRELEVLQRVALGLRNDAIARELAVAPNTVKYHLDEIYRKLRVRNRVQAMSWSVAHGLVTRAGMSGVGAGSGPSPPEVGGE